MDSPDGRVSHISFRRSSKANLCAGTGLAPGQSSLGTVQSTLAVGGVSPSSMHQRFLTGLRKLKNRVYYSASLWQEQVVDVNDETEHLQAKAKIER